ncbi:hypothetical protein D3C83_86950 [compost metagenome]
MRALGMPGDLCLLPRRKLRIGFLQELRRLCLKPGDLRLNVDVAGRRRLAQFVDPQVQRGDRLFEFEIGQHCGAA